MSKVSIDKEALNEMFEVAKDMKEKYSNKIGSPFDDYYNEDLDSCMCDFLDIFWFFEELVGSNE